MTTKYEISVTEMERMTVHGSTHTFEV